MQVEIASAPGRPWPRLSGAAAARLTLPGAILFTLIAELALAERKYAVFGGGYGQSRALEGPVEIAAFLAALVACHGLVFYLLYRLVRRLHGAETPLFHLNFLFVACAGWIGLLVAKYRALSYFSDALSFQIVRNLGGGSIVDALLYSLSEAGLVLAFAAGAGAAYFLLLWLLRRRWRSAAALPEAVRLSGKQLAAAFAAVPILLFAANRIEESRSALTRFVAPAGASLLLHAATDFDRDGYSLFSHPIDRHPFDGARHPYALDPLSDAEARALAAEAAIGPPPAIPAPRRHVVLIVLESTRGDVLGKRVGGRAVAPNLERLARQGSWHAEAYSHVGFTTESLQSLFTGLIAPADGRQSLVRDLLANGYRLGVFSGQPEDWGGTADLVGLRRASVYVDAMTLRDERASAFTALSSLAVDGRLLLREFDRHYGSPEAWRRPNFLYFNLQAAHFPYHWPGVDQVLPGDPIPRRRIAAANRAWLENTYWNAVAYNDRLVGELMARLERLGVLEDSLVVVTADHGESLFDDGFLGHGHMLNREQTHIPFVLSDRGISSEGPVGLADMRAIILAALGAEPLRPPRQRRGVLQYLGTLDRPGQIGIVESGEKRTTFDLNRQWVRTDSSGGWIPYARLAAGTDREAADSAVAEWNRERRLHRIRTDKERARREGAGAGN